VVTEKIKEMLLKAVEGRSLDDQINFVDTYGNHGFPETLKAFTFMKFGISQPSLTAENVVIMGCYAPFLEYEHVVSYFKLLQALGVDYTLVDKEYCCGAPLLGFCKEDERGEAIEASRRFIKRNSESASRKKAKKLAYFCSGCVHMAKLLVPEEADRHVYALDIVLDALKNRNLKLQPIKAAYFEGCHTNKPGFPNISLDWKSYRSVLDKVTGLSIVDIETKVCCSKQPDSIIQRAREEGAETLICACNACAGSLGIAAGERFKVKHLSEVLLEALGK
jgi:Fe-S oxidoreductase